MAGALAQALQGVRFDDRRSRHGAAAETGAGVTLRYITLRTMEEELDQLKGSTTGAGGSKMLSHLDQLEQEMKLLQWHKLANEAALKAALIRTRKLKREQQSESVTTREALEEKAAWMQQIVEEEHSKPLQVDAGYTADFEARERADEERLEEKKNSDDLF